MKRLFVLVLALALMLCACGESIDKQPEITTDTTVQSEIALPDESADPDPEKVAKAYLNGSEEGLNGLEKEMLALAKSAISRFYAEGMTDKEICIAAHDWIVLNTTYDVATLAVIPKATPYSDCAYGVLKSGVGICSGYTGTFKLFMDMLGVENQVISGGALDEEHAWNLVCLDEKWYHIDCTWDDYVPDYPDRPAFHMYLFLTDDDMEKTGHIWEKSMYPKADSSDLNYYKDNKLYAQNTDEAIVMLEKAIASGAGYAEVAINKPFIDIMYEGASAWATIFDDYYVLAFTIYR